MKKIKALLLVAVLTLTCVAFSACSQDPKSLKGEEVNRLEWLTAFEYIANGVAGQDKSVSFTSYGTYNHYKSTSSDDEDKKLTKSLNYTLQVNKNVIYAELVISEWFNEESIDENNYLYIDNNGKEELIYTSTDNVKWNMVSTTSNYLNSLSSAVNSVKNESFKFNKKIGMYEYSMSNTGFARIKFNNKKIVYFKIETSEEEIEVFFTDYDKTEIKKNEPKVEKNKLEIAYNAVKGTTNSYTKITLSEDCSYMNFKYYDGSNDEDFEALNNALGLPNGSVVATMRETTDLNKRDTAKENGIIVTWVRVGENYNTGNSGIYDVTYILE